MGDKPPEEFDPEAFDGIEVSEITPLPELSGASQADADRAAIRDLAQRVTKLENRVNDVSERQSVIDGVAQLVRRFRGLRKHLALWLKED